MDPVSLANRYLPLVSHADEDRSVSLENVTELDRRHHLDELRIIRESIRLFRMQNRQFADTLQIDAPEIAAFNNVVSAMDDVAHAVRFKRVGEAPFDGLLVTNRDGTHIFHEADRFRLSKIKPCCHHVRTRYRAHVPGCDKAFDQTIFTLEKDHIMDCYRTLHIEPGQRDDHGAIREIVIKVPRVLDGKLDPEYKNHFHHASEMVKLCCLPGEQNVGYAALVTEEEDKGIIRVREFKSAPDDKENAQNKGNKGFGMLLRVMGENARRHMQESSLLRQ